MIPLSSNLRDLIINIDHTQALYDAEQSSMDVIGDFSPVATTGFIAIESIRLKKWAEARLKNGGTVKPESVYATAK